MVSIEFDYGYGNSAKGGRRLPFTIRIKNEAEDELNGSLEILTRQSDGNVYAYAYPLSVAVGGSGQYEHVIPLGVGSDQLAVRIKNEAGDLVAAKRIELNVSRTPELFVGVLSDEPAALEYLNDVSVNYGQLRTHCIPLSKADFPAEREKLDSFDMILISSYRVSDLSVEQTRAMMQWMRDGGILVLGTGKRVNDTLGVFAPEFLDDRYENPSLEEVDFSQMEGMERPGEEAVTIPLVRFSLHGGSVLLSADSEPLVAAANKGNGVLAVTSFDFADLQDYAEAHSAFSDLLFTRILGNARLDALASETYGTAYDEYWSAQSLIDSGAPGLLPDTGGYGGLLGLYLVLGGPLLYILLRKKGMAIFYKRALALWALLFTVAVSAVSSRTRLRDTFYTYARIREAGEDMINEVSYLNLKNPYNASYTVHIKGDTDVMPLTATFGQEGGRTVTGEEMANVTIAEEDHEKQIRVRNVGAFTSRFFRLSRTEENVEQIGFSGQVSLFGEHCQGKIVNHYPFPVTHAALMFYGKMVPLGDLAPGESVDIGELPLYRIPLNDRSTVAGFISGVYDGAAGGDQHLRALERANFLSFYLSESTSGYTADARVVAFSEEEEEREPVLDRNLKNYGMTIVTSTLPVNDRNGNQICRSALIRTPEVLSGDYLAETNSYYLGEPVVLAYDLGSRFRIRHLLMEEPDPLFDDPEGSGGRQSFHGTISFYNYSTGSFDDIEDGKRIFDEAALRHYLSPDHVITVRYAEGAEQEGSHLDAALPVLTVIGEEE